MGWTSRPVVGDEAADARRQAGRAARRLECRVRREERVGDGVVLVRLARARGVDQHAARRHDARRVMPASGAAARPSTQIRFRAPPLEIGLAAQRAEARARRVHQHQIEDVAIGQRRRPRRAARSGRRRRRRAPASRAAAGRAAAGDRRRRPGRHRRRPTAPASCRLARRRRPVAAGPAKLAARSPTSCDASSWTTKPGVGGASSSGLPAVTTRPSGAQRVGSTATPVGGEAIDQRVAGAGRRQCPQRQRRRLVVEAHPGHGRFDAQARRPARHQPFRMGEVRGQRVDAGARRARVVGRRRSARPAARRRSTALTKPAADVCPASRVSATASDTIACAGRRSRWLQLVDAEPEDVEDIGIDPRHRAAAGRAEGGVERRAPAQHAGRQVVGEAAIAGIARGRRARGRRRRPASRRPGPAPACATRRPAPGRLAPPAADAPVA